MADKELLQEILLAITEAQSYTRCASWSPSMTDELKILAQKIEAVLAKKDNPVAEVVWYPGPDDWPPTIGITTLVPLSALHAGMKLYA